MVKKKVTQGSGGTSVQHTGQATPVETTKTIESPVHDEAQPMAAVGMSAGMTIRTGEYENVKIAVWVTLPCPPDEIDKVFNVAREWCDTRLTELHSEVVPE